MDLPQVHLISFLQRGSREGENKNYWKGLLESIGEELPSDKANL